MGIRTKSDKVLVKLNHHFYPDEAINRAISDFGEVADIDVKNNEIIMTPKEKIEPETLGYEFTNYVLGLMKNG